MSSEKTFQIGNLVQPNLQFIGGNYCGIVLGKECNNIYKVYWFVYSDPINRNGEVVYWCGKNLVNLKNKNEKIEL